MKFSLFDRIVVCITCMLLLTSLCGTAAQQSDQKNPQQATQSKTGVPPTEKSGGGGANPGSASSANQNAANEAGGQSGTAANTNDKAARDQAIAEFETKIAGVFDPLEDNSDYVPCFFTVTQLMQLRPAPPSPRLTDDEAERVIFAIMAEVENPANAKIFQDTERAEIVKNLKSEDFVGLTPSQALAKVIHILENAEQTAGPYAKVAKNAKPSEGDVSRFKNAAFNDVTTTAQTKIQPGNLAEQSGLTDELDKFHKLLNQLNFENPTGPEMLTQYSASTEKFLQNEAAPASSATGGASTPTSGTSALEAVLQSVGETADDAIAKPKPSDAFFASLAADTSGVSIGDNNATKLVAEAIAEVQKKVDAAHLASDAATQKIVSDEIANYKSDLGGASLGSYDGPKSLAQLSQASKDFVQQEEKAIQNGRAAAQSGISDSGNNAKTATNNYAPANNAVVTATRATLAAFKRPTDIGCAMSILSWSETRFAFGRLVANEYIGVQIIVRNINEKQEFLLQDAAVAVDGDLNGRKGRYFSGRDRQIVRALTVTQQSDSPRNIFMNVMSGVGTLLTTVVPFAGAMNFTDAATAWNTALVPGIGKAWTDNTTDQIKLLDDIGFSSAMNQKTMVPKSGTVMFVMFVPSKPFEQGWWTQPCAETLSSGVLFNKGPKRKSSASGTASGTQSLTSQVGIDLEKAREGCDGSWAAYAVNVEAVDSDTSKTYLRFKPVHYKSWSPNADALFRELAFAVVSGIHVQEAAQTKPTITAVNCPEDKLGNVDFSKQTNGAISCDVTGQNLDQVAKLRLRNAENQADSKTAEGSVTVSGDSTSGKASFQVTDLGVLQATAYKVYPVTKDGVEGAAGPTLHFAQSPFVFPTDQVKSAIDLANSSSLTVSVDGFHFDKVTKVQFTSKDVNGSPAADADVKSPTATSFTFTFAPSDALKKFDFTKTPSVSVTATIVTSDKTQPDQVPTFTLTIKQSAKPAAPAAKPVLKLDKTTISFATPQAVNTTSAAQTLQITNPGTTTVQAKISITKGNTKDFKVVGSCSAIDAGKTCKLDVTFSPTAAGSRTATLSVVEQSTGNPTQTIKLAGTGK